MKPIKLPLSVRIEQNRKKIKEHEEKPEYYFDKTPNEEYFALRQYGKEYRLADIDRDIYVPILEKYTDNGTENFWESWRIFFRGEHYRHDDYLGCIERDMYALNSQYIHDPRCFSLNEPDYRLRVGTSWYVGTVWENNNPTAYITRKYCKRHPECLYLMYRMIKYELDRYEDWTVKYKYKVDMLLDNKTDLGYITTIDNKRYPLNEKTFINHPFLIIQRIEHLLMLRNTLDAWGSDY